MRQLDQLRSRPEAWPGSEETGATGGHKDSEAEEVETSLSARLKKTLDRI